MDDTADWGAASGSASPPARGSGAGSSPPPDRQDRVAASDSYSSQLRAMLAEDDAGDLQGAPSDSEEFGEFVYTGRDAEGLWRDDDGDDRDTAPRTPSAQPPGSRIEDATSQKKAPSTGERREDDGVVGEDRSGSPPRPNGSADSLGHGRPSPLSPAGSRVTSASNDEFPALKRGGIDRARSSYGSIASVAQSTSGSQFPQRPPFHPAFSRLRSVSSQTTPRNRFVSSSTYNTALEFPPQIDGAPRRPRLGHPQGSATGSAFGGASRRSSVSNVLDFPAPASELPTATSVSGASSTGPGERNKPPVRTVKWSALKRVSNRAFPSAVGAAALSQAEQMVKSSMGHPTVMAVNGLIAIGTSRGWVLVFDFAQNLRCVCGTEALATEGGAVTALAVSQDHTFVAVGHETGSIHLYALAKPSQPARSVPPVTLPQVLSGRKEGHLVGSKICRLGFVGERHTAIVSSDDQGLAFYHSLGKVLMLASTDIIRMLGRYPDPANAPAGASTAASTSVPPQRPPLASAMTAPPGASLASPPDSRPASPAAGVVHRPRSRDPEAPQPAFPRPAQAAGGPSGKKPTVVLDMAPLPPGSAQHPASDALALVAMLTPTKLVLVGIKPTPRTWWRFALPRREVDPSGDQQVDHEDAERGFAVNGVLAWCPSCPKEGEEASPGAGGKEERKAPAAVGADPMLAWGWGRKVRVARVRSKGGETTPLPLRRRTPNPLKPPPPPVGIEVESVGELDSDDPVLALRWYTERIIIVLTQMHLDVFDVSTRQRIGRDPVDIGSLVASDIFGSGLEPYVAPEQAKAYSGSFGVYKRKLFVLRRHDVRAGAILSWADRVLALMQPATILDAIETATAYYEGLVDASTIALPDDPNERRDVLEPRLREILKAAVDFVFSDDRLRDGSHADGETIQRLFEDLVATCVHACLALEDPDWLFDELYEHYERNGIEAIFLDRLEPFVLSGSMHALPPSVTQRLIEIHAERREYAAAERIILDVEPQNLDLNQALHLCHEQTLYDALFHVYSVALHDWIAPVVEAVSVIRRIMDQRRLRPTLAGSQATPPEDISTSDDPEGFRSAWADGVSGDASVEALAPSAYKLFAYLSRTLLGLAYPSGKPFDEPIAARARQDVYDFLFAAGVRHWPAPDGPAVRTTEASPDEGGSHPYLRLLLSFDAEALLDTLDQAFEDPFLDEDGEDDADAARRGRVTRQRVVDLLLEISASDNVGLTSLDLTFIRIFVARNLPKYPQFVRLPEPALQDLLENLASDLDQSTIEDRQLATEYLLSSYTPRNTDTLISLLERAGFLRILRSVYRNKGRWADLVTTYIRDDFLGVDAFPLLREALTHAARCGAEEKRRVAETIVAAVPDLAGLDETALPQLAGLVSTFLPNRQRDVVDRLSPTPWREFAYLRCLFEADSGDQPPFDAGPELLLRYVKLLCRNDPRNVIRYLASRPSDPAQDEDLLAVCESEGSYDALVWALNKRGEPAAALAKADEALEARTDTLLELLLDRGSPADDLAATDHAEPISDASSSTVEQIVAVSAAATAVCVARSSNRRRAKDVQPEELWYRLLSSLVSSLRSIRSVASPVEASPAPAVDRRTSLSSLVANGTSDQLLSRHPLELLSTIIPDALSALVSCTTSREVSFPRLVRRLIDSTTRGSDGNQSYAEFKGIVTSMLDTYAFEGELLDLSSVITAQDLYTHVETFKAERERGWRPGRNFAPGCCAECLQPLWAPRDSATSPAMSRSASASLLAESLASTERPRLQKQLSIKGKEVDWPGLAAPTRSGDADGASSANQSLVMGRDGRIWHLACHLGRTA